jgi:DNA-binding LytR/AlgR family response regulator
MKMNRKILVIDDYGVEFWMFVRNIMFIKGKGHSCRVYFKNKRNYHCRWSLVDLIKDFVGYGLYLIHECSIININFVSKKAVFSFEIVTMIGGTVLEVSRRMADIYKRFKIEKWMDLKQ